MSDHAQHKRLLARFLARMAEAPGEAVGDVLAEYCHADCVWEVFHPFNTLVGEAAGPGFWLQLKAALPDLEYRPAFFVGGTYENRTQVSTLGHLIGTFDAPLLGIPATHGMAILRIGFNAIIREGRIAKIYVLLDLVDLMRQAGFYPLRAMPGSPEQWAFPPCDTGATTVGCDPARGARSLQIVQEMQSGLPKPAEIAGLENGPSRHSHHWHANMNWFGPAGIGSMRGRRGFRDFHGALFLQAFPDRGGFPRSVGGAEDAPGHYVRLGDGFYAVTGGWPSLSGTHLGPEWLGLPPTGRRIEMRVADWYRLDDDGLIIDNWVMMDIPHIVHQMGLDLFHDLRFAADKATPRWPL